ncbi:hypothetical protein [Nocardioides sp.]|uniref:hypothetical protein n=1 Tax=Nocardioides sp. TaxID=35761 RepID=UPI00356A8502
MLAETVLAETDDWFLAHGLTYFVPEQRAAARQALRLRRTVPLGVVLGLGAAGLGGVLAWLSDQVSAAPALLLSLGIVAALSYALTALKGSHVVGWALRRALSSLRTLLPMMSRALPLLLIFVTFLFINGEVWQMAASLETGVLWLTVLLFGGLAGGFLLVRLPEEVDRVDDAVDAEFLRRTCQGTPVEFECERLLARSAHDPVSHATVTGFERWNLIVVLVVIQAVQVLLLAFTVFVFFLFFGALIIDVGIQESWTGIPVEDFSNLPGLTSISVPLAKVSLFLAAFSGLYLTVATVTDDTYREQFFSEILRELENAVGVRAVYRTLRAG